MSRRHGRKNNATVIKDYLQRTFKDIAVDDLAEIHAAIVQKAKDGNVTAYRAIVDNMHKVVEIEQRDNQGGAMLEVVINRDGVLSETISLN